MRPGDEPVRTPGRIVPDRDPPPEVVELTNIQLSGHEYMVLAGWYTSMPVTTRWRWEFGGHTVAVDTVPGAPAGLPSAESGSEPDQRSAR